MGGDLQTMRNFLCRPRVNLGRFSMERLVLPLRDGSGDSLVATLHWPLDDRHPHPVVLLIHGLTGCQESAHLRISAAHLLRAGFPVLRINLRGAGPSRALCTQHYHAGRSQDLAHALAELPARIKRRGLVAIGFSLGGSVLVKYLGEAGRGTPLMAAVTVSTPRGPFRGRHFRIYRGDGMSGAVLLSNALGEGREGRSVNRLWQSS